WTQARRRGFSLSGVVTWMARRPADLAGLRRKGRIAAGCDADFAVFAPDEDFTVDPPRLHPPHPVTPHPRPRLRALLPLPPPRPPAARGACRRGAPGGAAADQRVLRRAGRPPRAELRSHPA